MVSDREERELPQRPLLRARKSLSKHYSAKSASFSSGLVNLVDYIGEAASGLGKRRSSVDMSLHSSISPQGSTSMEEQAGASQQQEEDCASSYWVRKATQEMCDDFLCALRVSSASAASPHSRFAPACVQPQLLHAEQQQQQLLLRGHAQLQQQRRGAFTAGHGQQHSQQHSTHIALS